MPLLSAKDPIPARTYSTKGKSWIWVFLWRGSGGDPSLLSPYMGGLDIWLSFLCGQQFLLKFHGISLPPRLPKSGFLMFLGLFVFFLVFLIFLQLIFYFFSHLLMKYLIKKLVFLILNNVNYITTNL